MIKIKRQVLCLDYSSLAKVVLLFSAFIRLQAVQKSYLSIDDL